LGGKCSSQRGFDRADGMGYRRIADDEMTLEALHDRLAARLLGACRSWHMLEPGSCTLTRRSLQRLADTPDPSRDVYEIVTHTRAP
jgi:aminopeptidase N